ncbi:MAG: PaaX family transcriptional regulator C-terminal domain-containing protein [Anaerolineae bacterium]
MRSQDKVFTLYGDYLRFREEPVSIDSLITLLGQLDLSEAAVRSVLWRMTRKGWLTMDRSGPKSFYCLTDKGRKLLEEGEQRIYHPPRNKPWDSSWYLIAYSIPEDRRRLRDRLRVRLLWLGCGALTSGVWISPHNIRDEVEDIATSLDITGHIEVFCAQHLGFSDVHDLISQCWDLPAVNARYAAFIEKYRPEYERCQAGIHSDGGLLPAECFVHRFMLVHEYREFPFLDPYLPRELLPEDWRGDEAVELFRAYHELLTDRAEVYVDQVCELAPAVSVISNQ